jgi:EAL domain-containing protein (putative c-di-GMP-specific phosphodiesterase class I)
VLKPAQAAPIPKVAPRAYAAPATPAAAPAAPAVAPAPSTSAAADANVQLDVLPFGKLRAGGQTRRFQVHARLAGNVRDPAGQDALVLQRLMGWLASHRSAWNSQPTSFTLNLSIATLEDERFAQRLAAALHSHGIAGDTFGFEIAEPLCTQRRAQVERFIGQCEKVGAWIVIDDFSLDSQVLALLRSKAVRVVKIDSKLTSSALKDKLCQAVVVATVQAAKVLGIHCAAKKVDSQAALQWLTAIGCDFAQGAALAAPQTLESLASSPDPTGLSPVLRPT